MATVNDAIPGKLMGVKIDGNFIDCQIDATYNMTMDTEEGDICKPSPTDTTDGASWAEPTAGRKSGTIDFSAKSLAKMTGFGLYELSNLFINGSNSVTWTFGTTQTTDYNQPALIVYSGDGIMTSFNINAPNEGESTFDSSITMVGKPTVSRVAVTS